MKPIKKMKNAILAVLQQENLQAIDKTLDMLQMGEKSNIFKLPYTFNIQLENRMQSWQKKQTNISKSMLLLVSSYKEGTEIHRS